MNVELKGGAFHYAGYVCVLIKIQFDWNAIKRLRLQTIAFYTYFAFSIDFDWLFKLSLPFSHSLSTNLWHFE